MDLVAVADAEKYAQEQQAGTNKKLEGATEYYDDNSSELYYSEESVDDDPTGFGLYGIITTAQLREALEESITTNLYPENPSNLEKLLQQNYADRIVYLETTETISTSGFPYIIMFHSFKEHAAKLLGYIDILFQSAQQYGDDICFGITDFENYEAVLNYRPGSEVYWKRYKKTGFNKYRRPDVFAVDTDNRIYQFLGALNEDSLKQFSLKLLNDELFKTEPLPEDDGEGFVRVGVAENFEQLVLKSDIDILLVLYGSKCPCSRELMPILDEVGKLLQDEDIIVVKINADLNYLPLKYYAWYYPTIYYVRRDDKNNLIEYTGGTRTVNDIIKFIAKHATNDLEEYNRNGRPRFD
ncbi:PREDICTED: protein disulfide-isomerase-like [Rhagoletis zephyria]|uniref:protein disulfide-isomerase-like n=1 Tax=Rhagoletis zephyria TaxID=28612 RepID=UPI00081126EE|nr:PREDICTED: protein disulfide-isomerase-like [Rhagoletis zephyria]